MSGVAVRGFREHQQPGGADETAAIRHQLSCGCSSPGVSLSPDLLMHSFGTRLYCGSALTRLPSRGTITSTRRFSRRPAWGKVEVVGLRPPAIRIAFDADASLRLLFQDGHERRELAQGSGRRLGVVRRKEDIAQG